MEPWQPLLISNLFNNRLHIFWAAACNFGGELRIHPPFSRAGNPHKSATFASCRSQYLSGGIRDESPPSHFNVMQPSSCVPTYCAFGYQVYGTNMSIRPKKYV